MDSEPEVRKLLHAIRTHIDSLPPGERLNGLLKFVAVMLNYLTREQVLNIRAEMIEAFGESELAEALNLLDGHLAHLVEVVADVAPVDQGFLRGQQAGHERHVVMPSARSSRVSMPR